jgi:phosphate uptake regulator
VKGSYVVYLPIEWVRNVNLVKGSRVSWYINEKNHEALVLKPGD